MGKTRILAGFVVLVAACGFLLGHSFAAGAAGPEEEGTTTMTSGIAGQAGDPLVTKSYIDGEVAKLQNKLDSLKVDAEFLRTEIDGMKADLQKLQETNS